MKTPQICTTDLNTFIELQCPPSTKDGMGGYTGDWETAYEAWAMVVPGKGKERDSANRQQAESFVDLYIRFDLSQNITTDMRVRLVDVRNVEHIYNIRDITDCEFKHEWLLLSCEEGVGT